MSLPCQTTLFVSLLVVVAAVVTAFASGIQQEDEPLLRVCAETSSTTWSTACVGIEGSATTTANKDGTVSSRYDRTSSSSAASSLISGGGPPTGEELDCTCYLARTLCEQLDVKAVERSRQGEDVHRMCRVQSALCAAGASTEEEDDVVDTSKALQLERMCLFPLCHLHCTSDECHYRGRRSCTGLDSDLCNVCFDRCSSSEGITEDDDPPVDDESSQ
eukprot:9476492-Pyramimonas_sp.AAC.1